MQQHFSVFINIDLMMA